jgi:aldose 1-epimerase
LGVGGLKATCTATNTGSETAPFGIGFHPYLLASRGGIDEAEINLSSKRRLLVDGRQLPVGDESVSGTGFDLAGRALKGLRLDDCFTELQLADDGAWHAYLHTDDRRAEIWADGAFGYVMCYTGDSLAEKDRRKAIAVEPMTCPPNAFRSGTRVIELAPEERWQASWGIAATFTGRGDAPAGNPAELGA